MESRKALLEHSIRALVAISLIVAGFIVAILDDNSWRVFVAGGIIGVSLGMLEHSARKLMRLARSRRTSARGTQ